ncbi:hypothetical protein A3B51_02445 [Candidatus Curtissbacteria bacterium RIFCSPLOWO2_01_FULL_41_18]|uniref:Uncharacterized protein n=1 Tax=Candidatus Curtissbacteria bacterium RIFCSPLOWO2_01_FULL_41_18 TaxID=1797727 RepID=A0A1F5HL88_9BACT|nr:MAG: hypothetical protein A3B51_02445 [Candidatus Curtissbacteria bacterium RIFCSPLOWO2_01_FULL_41_18]
MNIKLGLNFSGLKPFQFPPEADAPLAQRYWPVRVKDPFEALQGSFFWVFRQYLWSKSARRTIPNSYGK